MVEVWQCFTPIQRLLKKCSRNLLQGILDADFAVVAFPKNHGNRSCPRYIYENWCVFYTNIRELKSFLLNDCAECSLTDVQCQLEVRLWPYSWLWTDVWSALKILHGGARLQSDSDDKHCSKPRKFEGKTIYTTTLIPFCILKLVELPSQVKLRKNGCTVYVRWFWHARISVLR